MMRVLLDTCFDTLEQLIDEIEHWDLDFRLLGAGGFSGSVKQLYSPDVLVAHARFRRGLDQAGATPSGYRTFVIPGNECMGFWWRRQPVTQNDLLVFPPGGELHSASRSDFEVFTVSLRTEYLEQLVHELGISHVPRRERELIPLASPVANTLRALAGMIVHSSGGASAQVYANELAQQLVMHATSGKPGNRVSSSRRYLAVERVIDYIRSTQGQSSSLSRLCQVACVSERTLQYAFKERYGIPPNVFVKRWNLNSARRELLQSDPDNNRVTPIAAEFGFVHQGQFAADYRKLFLESPCETLKRSN